MQIKIFRDLNQYTLTSSIKKADIELIKKYRPDALKVKDDEGNDVFSVSYVEGKPYVGANGVTFGAASAEGEYAMITGELPHAYKNGETAGDYIADKVGAALSHIKAFEETLPSVASEIAEQRKALIEGIATV